MTRSWYDTYDDPWQPRSRRERPTRDDRGRSGGPPTGRFVGTARDISGVDMDNAQPGTTIKVYATITEEVLEGWLARISGPSSVAGMEVLLPLDQYCLTRRISSPSARTRITQTRLSPVGVSRGAVVVAQARFFEAEQVGDRWDPRVQYRGRATADRWGLSLHPQHVQQSQAA